MSPLFSFPTVEESDDENEVGDEYETKSYENADGFLTKEQEEQFLLDEEALWGTLEEQARAEKEWEERIREEQTHDELFMSEFVVYFDSESD